MVKIEISHTYFDQNLFMNQANLKSTTSDILEHFVDLGYLSSAQLVQLKSSNISNLSSLIDNGLVPERVFADALSTAYQIDHVHAEQLPSLAVEGTSALSSFLIEHEALPLSLNNGVLRVAVSDPSDRFILQVLRSKFNCEVEVCVASRSDLLEALTTVYPATNKTLSAVQNTDLPDDLDSDSALVRELHRLIQRAISVNASDIHFEPIDSGLRVRFRVHGMLRDIHSFEVGQRDQVVARLKLMSKLDVTQRRHAQNGRFKFPADGRVIDLRVSSLPLHDGESIVLRLLEFGLSQLSLQELGFSDAVANSMGHAINTQQGLVLITGPTGSGKSTTLYSLLNQLNKPELKLITIEDPVELNIAGINQIQVDDEYGLSFSAALKSVLRQDPDVVMVGEIRDAETARLAAQAALTGHLVLATLHTASAASAITRLQNLGLPEYLVSSTVKAVLAQRLLRCKCQNCVSKGESNSCSVCAGTQYSGRTTIAELLPATVFDNAVDVSEEALSTQLLEGVSLKDDAQRVINSGVTDSAEVFRVLGVNS